MKKKLHIAHIIASSAMIAGGIGAFVLRVLGPEREIPAKAGSAIRHYSLQITQESGPT